MSGRGPQRPILIAGFHRSGTSAVARVFHGAGVHLGDELLGAEPANPHGHFEDLAVIDMHDRFLKRSGHTWKSTDSGGPLSKDSISELRSFIAASSEIDRIWGVKDPRLCVYLGAWLEVVPDARVVVVIRRPGNAVRSLHMRHSRRHVDTRGVDPSDLDFWRTPDLGLALWVHYHRRLLAALDSANAGSAPPPLIVDYDDRRGLADLLDAANSRWGTSFPASSHDAVDPTLGTSPTAPIEVRSKELLGEARSLWTDLTARITVT